MSFDQHGAEVIDIRKGRAGLQKIVEGRRKKGVGVVVVELALSFATAALASVLGVMTAPGIILGAVVRMGARATTCHFRFNSSVAARLPSRF